jgi:hypothetical protein
MPNAQNRKSTKKLVDADARRFARWKIPLAPPLIVGAIILLLVPIHFMARNEQEKRAAQPSYALLGGR